MTAEDYLKQNLAGFENDTIAKEKMKSLIIGNNVKTVIETGTYLGATAKHFDQWCKNVLTIEVKKEHFDQAWENLKGTNVQQFLGSSEQVLDKILNDVDKESGIFFFLDAHWEAYNPLLDELAVIAKHGIKPIIAIHDFKVPDHPELGFDTYGEIVYEWNWIKNSIETIYGLDGYTVEYNSEATGARRGIIYILPK